MHSVDKYLCEFNVVLNEAPVMFYKNIFGLRCSRMICSKSVFDVSAFVFKVAFLNAKLISAIVVVVSFDESLNTEFVFHIPDIK